MKGKNLILTLILLANIVGQDLHADQTTICEQKESIYTKPSSVRDTVVCGDSIVVIHTVCAPICSSHVRVYNKEGELHAILKPPFKSAFPEAYLENGKVLWRDNDNYDYTPVP